MENKVWKLRIKKSYIDFAFEFPQAEGMARFLNHFMSCYQPDKDDDVEITVKVVEDGIEEIKEDE